MFLTTTALIGSAFLVDFSTCLLGASAFLLAISPFPMAGLWVSKIRSNQLELNKVNLLCDTNLCDHAQWHTVKCPRVNEVELNNM